MFFFLCIKFLSCIQNIKVQRLTLDIISIVWYNQECFSEYHSTYNIKANLTALRLRIQPLNILLQIKRFILLIKLKLWCYFWNVYLFALNYILQNQVTFLAFRCIEIKCIFITTYRYVKWTFLLVLKKKTYQKNEF